MADLQEIWKQHEVALKANRKLNLALLKEVKIDKAKSSLKSLLFLPISTLVFFIAALTYSLHFTITNWETWYIASSGICLSIFSFLFIMSSFRQLKQLLTIDYNAPVIKLQKDISRIKSSVLDNLRIATGMMACFPVMIIFYHKVLFDYDFVANLSPEVVHSYSVIFILVEILVVIFFRLLRPKNINKKWMNWLLQGSGSQVDEALSFINQIKEFEME